jgi:hypothetical protein
MIEENGIQQNQVAGTGVIRKIIGRGRAKIPSFKLAKKNSFLPPLCNYAQRDF